MRDGVPGHRGPHTHSRAGVLVLCCSIVVLCIELLLQADGLVSQVCNVVLLGGQLLGQRGALGLQGSHLLSVLALCSFLLGLQLCGLGLLIRQRQRESVQFSPWLPSCATSQTLSSASVPTLPCALCWRPCLPPLWPLLSPTFCPTCWSPATMAP